MNLALPGNSVVKNLSASVGDVVLIPEVGRSPGEGNDQSTPIFLLENPMDIGSWWVTVHEVKKSQT